MKLELIATATFGLEAVVKREIQELGYRLIKTEDGKVTYLGKGDRAQQLVAPLRGSGPAENGRVHGENLRRTFSADKGHCLGGADPSGREIHGDRKLRQIHAPQCAQLSEHYQKSDGGASE